MSDISYVHHRQKRSLILVLAFLPGWLCVPACQKDAANSASAEPYAVPHTSVIASFTLLDSISSATAHPGQVVRFAATRDIVFAGKVLVSKGAAAYGEVTTAKRKGKAQRDGVLVIELRHTTSTQGHLLLFARQPVPFGKGERYHLNGWAVMHGGPFALLGYLPSGKEIEIPAGHLVDAMIEVPTP